jgi:hypothetical protein
MQAATARGCGLHLTLPKVGHCFWLLNDSAFTEQSTRATLPSSFSGGLTETTFAIRFGTSENAAAFKEKYEETKQEMEKLIAGEDAEGGAAEADEAAAAIESLSVGKDAGAE